MKQTEKQIREALANNFAQRAANIYRDEKVIAEMRESASDVIESLTDDILDQEGLSEEEKNKVRDTLLERVTSEISLVELSLDVAAIWLRDEEFYKRKFGDWMSYRKQVGQGIPKKFKTAYENIIGLTKRRDNIVSELVGIAELEGLEKATANEQILNAVIREFKDPNDFITYFKSFAENMVAMHDTIESFQNCGPQGCRTCMDYSCASSGYGDAISKIAPGIMDTFIDTVIRRDFEKISS